MQDTTQRHDTVALCGSLSMAILETLLRIEEKRSTRDGASTESNAAAVGQVYTDQTTALFRLYALVGQRWKPDWTREYPQGGLQQISLRG